MIGPVYNLTDNTVDRLCVLFGWHKVTPKIRMEHGKVVADIINFALKKLKFISKLLCEEA